LTERLRAAVHHVGLALGGQAGARLAERLGMRISGKTVIRLVQDSPLPSAAPPPCVLGIDDWCATRSRMCSRKDSRKEALTWGSAPSTLPG
jgi:hypothetical protein